MPGWIQATMQQNTSIGFNMEVKLWISFEIDFKTIFSSHLLEPSCCKKWQKSPNQETCLGNRGHLKVVNDTKLILND